MLAVAILLTTTTTLAPAAGLNLAPGPPQPTVVPVAPAAPAAPGPMPPLRLGTLAASVALLMQWTRRKISDTAQLPVTAPAGVRLVFVSGHGSEVTGTFDEMMERLGIADTGNLDVVQLDYRDVEPDDSHVAASHGATVEELGDGLANILRTMARAGDEPIYLIGFSKGGAAIAHLIARWDLHPDLAVGEVTGAALLDPPISGGWLGAGQSVARGPLSVFPNDGGYTPRHCDLGLFDCHDTRAHLGDQAGIEVVVFRNPDALVTNFDSEPPGLRVYDISDPDASGLRITGIARAHSYPLRSAAVAACIADEMRAAASCNWPIRRWLAGEW